MSRVNYSLFVCQVNKKLDNVKKKLIISGFSFHSYFLNQRENDYCVGRESNPGQLLGRQLCSPLYHRRFDVEVKLKNWLDRTNVRLVNKLFCEIPL